MKKVIEKRIKELNIDCDMQEKINFLLKNGFNVYFHNWSNQTLNEKRNYFIYEKDGFFAYYGVSASFDWLKETCTKHKPNTNSGSGWQIIEKGTISPTDLIYTWTRSKNNILTGKEQNFDYISEQLKFCDMLKIIF